MQGQMMGGDLLISGLITHAAKYHADTEIFSVNTGGGEETTTWSQVESNSRALARALGALGIENQARCGTLAWNNRRHLEIYFGTSGGGYVCHTLNPRLPPQQLAYILNHAEDKVLFVERTFLPLVAAVKDECPLLEHIILMEGSDDGASDIIPGIMLYDDFIADGPGDFVWPQFDEKTASSLCYTSGTTGNPKGVLYSHRSTLLHAMASNMRDCIGFSAQDVVMPVVPMFHVNAWGTPYACAMSGARMVMPGPGLDGASLVKLIDTHEITIALGVPTIWLGLLNEAKKTGSKLASLERTVIGGSACPPSMIDAFREDHGVDTIHAWGMTELSPLGSTNQPLAKHKHLPIEEQHALRVGQGRPPFGVELAIVDEDGNMLPNDGVTQGDLVCRGEWVLDSYFRTEPGSALNDGWFYTGDVAVLDPDGYLTIKDRSKDIIKSGGEWISSVDLENIAVAHPALANAAVIGARHEKWDERPILLAVRAEGADPSEAEVLSIFDNKIASWQVPDKVIFVDELPLGATGKVLKRKLKEEYGDVLMA
ncbi:long-chain-fatty-acid--CoA ligase [Aliishimia ponticola]|uniref:3-methylmercaptopropionyl-CoA ligase n=1 Tax=Aliishimia ponticola TaxID=2499833 RepID=A0A4S4NG30_9RHOB|nr:long-chain-fatty-acid--CoA ligase [Aliishimia ponticola]THH38596.1 long-chain-fatty-acid--CoA ligase [Aliishimia ponticola]